MNQQYPPQQPHQPQPGHPAQQPGWGAPQQPGYGYPPPPPGFQAPAPMPPKKSNTGKIIGFGCLGIVVLLVLIGAIGAALGGDTSDGAGDKATVAEEKRDDKPAPAAGGDKAPEKAEKPKPVEEPAVKLTAKKTSFAKGFLADGTAYTSVLVTISNNSKDTISVNPLYFAITDSNGTKHTAELGVDENQIDTVDLAPGENVSGAVTGKGTFTADYVTYTDGLLGDPVRVDVS
ncbi:DUF4352 domain-containing protein [Streptomyces sp. NPDC002454]